MRNEAFEDKKEYFLEAIFEPLTCGNLIENHWTLTIQYTTVPATLLISFSYLTEYIDSS